MGVGKQRQGFLEESFVRGVAALTDIHLQLDGYRMLS